MRWRHAIQAAGVLALSGCWSGGVQGTGDVARVARPVAAFQRISTGGTIDVDVKVGPATSVIVEAQPNIADLIKTTVADGTLTVENDENFHSDKPVVVHITAPRIDALAMKGASHATVEGLHGGDFSVEIAGVGTVDASGMVDHLKLESGGAGNAQLDRLAARDAVVRLAGVGNASIAVTGTLDVEIAGVGSVTYRGSPKIVHQTIGGVGHVTQTSSTVN